jgi:LPXTG-site transpeptidase (sortase) family protein
MDLEVKEIENAQKRNRFLKRTVILFVIFFVILAGLNLTPSSVREINNVFFSYFIHDEERENAEKVVETSRTGSYTEPLRIVIPKVGTDTKVINPTQNDSKTLDSALLLGAVRYPGSGDLEDKHTMFLFGHSSYLPVVHNKAYQSFNHLQKLSSGDEIKVYSSEKEYIYKVDKVELTTADEGFVNLSELEHKLVLATCNSFGKKQERYVVTASFVGSYPITK